MYKKRVCQKTHVLPDNVPPLYVVKALLMNYPDFRVLGYHDLSPDLNGDGVISPDEWLKRYPCFDVSPLFDD